MKKSLPLSAISALALAIHTTSVYSAETIETVIVTANKIKEDVQQTAASIEALSEEKLAAAGISSLADVAKMTPGLQLEQTGGGLTATVRIRGIGTPGFSILDPSAPIFIDGVAQGRTGAGFQDLVDIERVEVLRGPQGTLYGRNSTAGAINVWTKDANTHRWEGSAQLQMGNYNDREFKGSINVPMVDDILAGRFSIFSTKQDGYIDNVTTGKTGLGYADRVGGRAKMLVTPVDTLKIQWITDYSKSIGHPMRSLVVTYPKIIWDPNTQNDYADPAFPMASNPQYPGAQLDGTLPKPDPYSDRQFAGDSWTQDKNISTSLNVDWDITSGFLADNTFSSISAFQKYENIQDLDSGVAALKWGRTSGVATTRGFSQELRLSASGLNNWDYVAGLYYYKERVKSDQHTDKIDVDSKSALDQGLFGPDPRAGGQLSNSFSHSHLPQTNKAVFGQLTYHFTDQFSLTAGLRESWVHKTGDSDVDILAWPYGFTNPLTPFKRNLIDDLSITEKDLSGVVKAKYFIDSDVMLYASIDRGFKPGGFNRLIEDPNAGASGKSTQPTTFRKENSNNFELGLKSKWLDNRLQANMSVFHLEFINYHNQVTSPNSNIIVENIKSVTSDGVEIDLEALLSDHVTTGLGLTYIDAKADDNSVPSEQSTDSTRPGQSQIYKKGQRIEDTSQFSANGHAEFAYPLASGPAEAFIRGDISYRSEFLLGSQGVNKAGGSIYQGGYSLMNLRFGVRKLDEHWQLTGWIKNLTDKQYAVAGGVGVIGRLDGASITPGAPRTYGLAVQYDY